MTRTLDIKIQGIDILIKKTNAITAFDTLNRGLLKAGAELITWILENRITGSRKTNPPDILGVKSGRLRSSIVMFNSLQDRDGVSVRIGTNVEYARIHEYGGVINKFARSEIFLRPRFVRGAKKGSFKKITKKNSRFGRGFTFNQYAVNIPARPFLRPAIDDESNQQRVGEVIAKEIIKAIERA